MSNYLKIICYLCPSIPYDLFNAFADELSRILSVKVDIDYDPTSSGPMDNDTVLRNYDLAFVCSPSYLSLIKCPNNTMELLEMNFVYEDDRNPKKECIYFSDIMVNDPHVTMDNFHEKNLIFGYNDLSSLSGYYSMIQGLNKMDKDMSVFSAIIQTGSHLQSIESLRKGEINIASIDSICLKNFMVDLLKIGYFGPNPIQPILINSKSKFKNVIYDALMRIDISKLRPYGVIEIKHMDASLYEEERILLETINKRTKTENHTES